MIIRLAAALIALAVIPTGAPAGPVRDYRLVAELVPETDAIVPGEPITICLNIKHDQGWHTYWKNPGIAGVPIKLDWSLPEGFEAGPIQWARPQRVLMAIYNTFGYEDEITLLVDIKTPKNLKPGTPVKLETKTTWMMCSQRECHFSSTKLDVTIPVEKAARPHERGKKLADKTRASMPVENRIWKTSAKLRKKAATLTLSRVDGSDADPEPDDLYFFSGDGLIDSHEEQKITRESPGVYKLVLPRAEFGPKNPTSLDGVLLCKSGAEPKALSIRAKLEAKSPKKK